MGRANTQERRAARLAMTPDILWLLKQKLAKAKMPVVKKRLLWATATFLFVGSLRSGEVLPCFTFKMNNCLVDSQIFCRVVSSY